MLKRPPSLSPSLQDAGHTSDWWCGCCRWGRIQEHKALSWRFALLTWFMHANSAARGGWLLRAGWCDDATCIIASPLEPVLTPPPLYMCHSTMGEWMVHLSKVTVAYCGNVTKVTSTSHSQKYGTQGNYFPTSSSYTIDEASIFLTPKRKVVFDCFLKGWKNARSDKLKVSSTIPLEVRAGKASELKRKC